jgi:hypothetical protein
VAASYAIVLKEKLLSPVTKTIEPSGLTASASAISVPPP